MTELNADNIFEIAEHIERRGADFYHKAAELADENRRSVLLALAEMEYNHERAFATMRTSLSNGTLQPTTPAADSQGALYLKAAAAGNIFGQTPTPESISNESIDRIFEIAISLEKDSIVFYQSMKALVPPGEARDQLDWIIDQEIGHILDLTKN
ncbi:MAG: ferritin family protein [bacterium]|nr:ferritin family protein [bacterium]